MSALPVITEEMTPVSGRPDYWSLMARINRGKLPEARKVAGRWFIPLRLVQDATVDETLAEIQQVGVDTIRRNLVALRGAGFIAVTRSHSPNCPTTYGMTFPSKSGDVSPVLDVGRAHSLDDQTGDVSPVIGQSGGQTGDQPGDDRYPTTYTPKTSITYDTYAADRRSSVRVSTDEVVYQELILGLVEAIESEYISLPHSDADSYEQQSKAVLDDVLAALAVAGIDIPLLYLNAILTKDGAFQFGLAMRELWRVHVGEGSR